MCRYATLYAVCTDSNRQIPRQNLAPSLTSTAACLLTSWLRIPPNSHLIFLCCPHGEAISTRPLNTLLAKRSRFVFAVFDAGFGVTAKL